jgi:ribosomal protein L10
MSRQLKETIVGELERRFRDINQSGCVLIDYQGMKADEALHLRQQIRQRGGEVTVVKNSLFILALQRLGADELSGLIQGPIAVVRAENVVEAARAVKEAHKLCPSIAARGAYVDGTRAAARHARRRAAGPAAPAGLRAAGQAKGAAERIGTAQGENRSGRRAVTRRPGPKRRTHSRTNPQALRRRKKMAEAETIVEEGTKQYSEKINAVLDTIGGFTLLELSELVSAFEEKFGIQAAAMAPMAGVAAGAAGGG